MTDVQSNEAILNITWALQMGDMSTPIAFDTPDAQVLECATEAVRSGSVPGISPDQNVDFDGYFVERFAAADGLPNRIMLRPKTSFG